MSSADAPATITAGDARRVVELAREHFIAGKTGGDEVAALMARLQADDVFPLIAAIVVVGTHALDGVEQLGGDADEALRQGIDLAYWALTTAESK